MEISDENLKTLMIIIMVLLLFASVLGINVLSQSIYWIQDKIAQIANFLVDVLKSVGYDAGDIINVSSNSVSSVAKISIDLGNGAMNDIGNLLKGQQGNVDNALNHPHKTEVHDPKPSSSDESDRWCYTSENTCTLVKEKSMCKTGKLHHSEAHCLETRDK